MAVTSSFDLFKLKFLPSMRTVFEHILRRGRFWSGDRVIELCDADGNYWAKRADDPMYGRIILRSAQAAGGLESATAKAAILDECGMDEFTLGDWEAIQRRLSLHQARVCGGTTLYNRGWLKSDVYDRWKDGDPDYDIIQYPSYINPSFPKAEYERIVQKMASWKVNMFYRGQFDVPEGMVYDCFDTLRHTIDDFEVPADWQLWGGTDFGGANQAGLLLAERPEDKHLFVVKEYWEGHKSIKQHAAALKPWQAKRWWGGAPSEDQWRREFGTQGMPVLKPPIKELDVGIDIVYEQLCGDNVTVFKSCSHTIDQLGTYSYKTSKDGTLTDVIADKETYHLGDCLRYVLVAVRRRSGKAKVRRLVSK